MQGVRGDCLDMCLFENYYVLNSLQFDMQHDNFLKLEIFFLFFLIYTHRKYCTDLKQPHFPRIKIILTRKGSIDE